MPIVIPQPPTPAGVNSLIAALRRRYRFLYNAPIGRSVRGEPIPALLLGNGREYVLYAAAFHAQEWLTTLVTLRLCEELCQAAQTGQPLADIDFRGILTQRSLVFVPLMNPDGVQSVLEGGRRGDTRWQANANGVDLNHNYDAGWEQLRQMERAAGIDGPAPRQYGGTAPHSEPETAALVALCGRIPFRHVLALHSQGEEIYWQYGDRTPPQSRMMADVLAAASGYTVAAPDGLASHGGFKDWFIATAGRPGFTLELGRGENPLPLSDFEDVYAKAREMLLLAAVI